MTREISAFEPALHTEFTIQGELYSEIRESELSEAAR